MDPFPDRPPFVAAGGVLFPKHQGQRVEQASPTLGLNPSPEPGSSRQDPGPRCLESRIPVAVTRELLRVGNRGQSVASGDRACLSKALPTPEADTVLSKPEGQQPLSRLCPIRAVQKEASPFLREPVADPLNSQVR